MKRIITYGTFDLFHHGHINLLKRARALGDYLMVGLSTDEFNRMKGKHHIVDSYIKRKQTLESLPYVDFVFPERNWEQKSGDVADYNADIFVMGHDWEGKFDWLNAFCEVIYLPRTPDISSEMLRGQMGLTASTF